MYLGGQPTTGTERLMTHIADGLIAVRPCASAKRQRGRKNRRMAISEPCRLQAPSTNPRGSTTHTKIPTTHVGPAAHEK